MKLQSFEVQFKVLAQSVCIKGTEAYWKEQMILSSSAFEAMD